MLIDLMDELNHCISLCTRLEGLLQQDKDDFSRCVTGQVYDAYIKNVDNTIETVNTLKYQILLLQQSCQSLPL